MAVYIALVFAVLIFSLVYMLFYNDGIESDRIKGRLAALETTGEEMIADEELNKSLAERFINPMTESFVKFLSKVVPQTSTNHEKAENQRKLLRQAGMTIMPSEYAAIKLIVIIGTAVLFFILAIILKLDIKIKVFLPFFGAYAAFAILRFSLFSKIRKRRENMESQMPDVLDMLSVNVEAGLGFEQAMLHIIEHFKGPLIDEFTITYREMSMGRSRRDALMGLSERCDIDDLRSFTGSVVQANKLGISLKNVLHTQAASIRDGRRSKIEEKAHKMAIKILLPMVIFIFPVIFIMLMGPAVISIMEVFK